MKNIWSIALFTLALPVLAATEGTPINERRPLNATGTVTVNNISGLIEVRAWNKNEVEITGTLGRGSEKLRIHGNGERLDVEVVLPRRANDVEGSELHLRVPEGARVELEGVSADLVVSGMRGPVWVDTVSGDVRIGGDTREVHASSVSGDLDIQAPSSSDTQLESVSGDIDAKQLSGVLRAETVSGDLNVSGSSFKKVDLQCVSGDIDLSLTALSEDAEISMDSVSGDIHFNGPKALNARVELETYSGVLRSDFGKPDADEPERLEVTLGSGKGRIRLESHSGDITLKGK